MKIVVPERVVDAALAKIHKLMDEGLGVGKVSTKAAITAALQEWIASGEAFDLGVNPNGKKHLLIRMEPDND